jgi:hypothetical protein
VPVRTMQLHAWPPHAAISHILWLDTKQTPGHKQCCFYFWHMETQFVFTAETVHSINTTKHHILSFVHFIYTYKNVVFPEALRCGKIFRCFSYDFSFYMKSVSTILSVILSKQQIIIVTHLYLYLLSVSVPMKRKHTPYPFFSAKQ